MRRLSAFVHHAIAAGIMAWGWFGLLKVADKIPLMAQKGGYFQFLTNQGLILSWTCMVVSLFCDVFPSVAVTRHLKKALLLISLPLSFVVSTIYWSLITFLPHLIVPPSKPGAVTTLLPLPLDLALHASPLLSLLVDFFVFEPKFSKPYVQKVAPAAVAAFAVWYASFVEYCATFNGTFPYPFLTHSSFSGRALIYTAAAGIALVCFRTLNALHA